MNLQYKSFPLKLNYPFRISNNARTSTSVVFTEIEHDGFCGYGEASMPPYLLETKETAFEFLSSLDFSGINIDNGISEIRNIIDEIPLGNNAAKASVDIAFFDLLAKRKNIPVYKLFNSDPDLMPFTSFTMGIDTKEVLKVKMKDAEPFRRIKIKLGTSQDKEIIRTIRELTDKEIIVDANRGWDKEFAAEMIDFLAKLNCAFVEQPLPVEKNEDMYWLKSRSSLPLFADESCKRLNDIDSIKELFHGINIKLMKSTGISEAFQMINKARTENLKVMIGCMSESSCGIMAAAALAPLCDHADLDSPWMISNNPFINPELRDGKIQLNDLPGLGITWKENIFEK